MVLAAVVGVVCGSAAVLFYEGINFLIGFLHQAEEETLATQIATLPWYTIILITLGGGLIVGQILRFLPDNITRGVPQVMEVAALQADKLSLRHGIISAAATVISLGSGASAGREGPVVHLGATLSAFVTRTLHLNPKLARTLLGCGVAAAVAASFNAPLAGVFFALEIIIGHYALHTFTPIVISAITGTIISRVYFGDFPAFFVSEQVIVSYLEFPAFFLLGIISALAAVAFMTLLNAGDKFRVRAHRIPYWLQPALGGIIVGGIIVFFPEVASVGYEATSIALGGGYELSILIALFAAKALATVVTLASRFGGGVFSPSLFLGAMVGSAYGIIAALVFPDLASSPSVYAIVGMAAFASSVLGAPISTMLIVFEITGDYNVTIAVMIASAVSTLVSQIFYDTSYFHMQLHNRGIYLEGGRATYLLHSEKVRRHMVHDFFTVLASEPLSKCREMLVMQGGGNLIVTDESGRMLGVLSFSELPPEVFDTPEADLLTAGDKARPIDGYVHADDTLCVALNQLEASGEEIIPVLSDSERRTIIGLVHLKHVMKQYNKALLDAQGQDGL